MNLPRLVGRHLMIGIPGNRVTAQTVRLFEKTQAAGLIVFRPNFASAKAFRKFISDLESKLGRKLLVAVDHEGGRVVHLREGVTVFPDNWTLGNAKREKYAAQQGMIEAKELRRLGIDLNLAPTLDVLRENFSPNIGIRSYGKNPGLVSRFGAARIRAMQKNGLSACAKHFPGLGPATLDPHLDLPVLGADWKEVKSIHLKPFLAAMKACVDTIMTSHPVYPKLDPRKVPVTFSKRIVREFLRGELNYKGVILSDDLEMGALRGICSIGESAVRAVEAGHDMVLICHEGRACEEAAAALLKAYETKRLKIQDLHMSVSRIDALIQKRARRFAAGQLRAEKQGASLAQKIAREGLTVRDFPRHREEATGRRGDLGFEIASSRLYDGTFKGSLFSAGDYGASASGKKRPRNDVKVIFQRVSALSDKIHIEKECLNEKQFLTREFAKAGLRADVRTVSLNPSASEIQSAVRAVKGAEPAVFFCYDAHWNKNTEKLLKQIQSAARNAVIVLMRDPYDAAFVKKQTPVITVYGFRAAQLRAAIEEIGKFFNKMSLRGTK